MVDQNLCTGCGACALSCPKSCIAMVPNDEGFLYPVIDANICVHCGKCDRICPVKQPACDRRSEPTAYAAICREDTIRMGSSSGGVAPLLMEAVLQEGGYVCGAVYTDTFSVAHLLTKDAAMLPRFQGAKYAQSDLGQVYREIREKLDADCPVLFIGTPCQVAGLYAYLDKPYARLITVDMICHGVVSPRVWQSYLLERSHRDAADAAPEYINLRDKSSGWSRYSYSVLIAYKNGKTYQKPNGDDPFMQGFVKNIYLRSSCEMCAFKGLQRAADITLGDYWGVWDQHPDMDDNKGTGLILVHRDGGAKLFERIRENLLVKEVSVHEAGRENPSMFVSSKPYEHKDAFWNAYRQTGTICDFLYKVFPWTKPSWREKLGNFRRSIFHKKSR